MSSKSLTRAALIGFIALFWFMWEMTAAEAQEAPPNKKPFITQVAPAVLLTWQMLGSPGNWVGCLEASLTRTEAADTFAVTHMSPAEVERVPGGISVVCPEGSNGTVHPLWSETQPCEWPKEEIDAFRGSKEKFRVLVCSPDHIQVLYETPNSPLLRKAQTTT